MKSISLLILILAMAVASAHAQVPGYLGNKLTVNYDIDLAPDWMTWINLDLGNNADSLISPQNLYHLRHSFSASYAVSRRGALGFMFGFGTANHKKQDVSFESFDKSDIPFGYSQSDFNDYFSPLSKYMRTNIYEIGAFYQIHTKSYIAPVGSFIQLRASMVLGKTNYYDALNKLVLIRPVETSQTASSFKFSFMYGHNHVFLDKFIFRYGYEIGWDFLGSAAVAGLGGYNPEPFLDENYLANQAMVRSFYTSWFTLKFGLGFIPPLKS